MSNKLKLKWHGKSFSASNDVLDIKGKLQSYGVDNHYLWSVMADIRWNTCHMRHFFTLEARDLPCAKMTVEDELGAEIEEQMRLLMAALFVTETTLDSGG